MLAAGARLGLRGDGAGDFEPVHPKVSGVLLPADARGLAVVDFDGDGQLDIAVANNNGPVQQFLVSPKQLN